MNTTPPSSADELSVSAEIADTKQDRVMLVEYQTGASAETSIISKLTARGFILKSFGTAEGMNADRSYFTILLGSCDERLFHQALEQVKAIIPVIKAEERPLQDTVQHLRADVMDVSADERRELKRMKASIEETVSGRCLIRNAKGVTSMFAGMNAKIIDRKTIDIPDGDFTKLSIRIQNMSSVVRTAVDQLEGFLIEPKVFIKMTGGIPQIDKMKEHIRKTFEGRLVGFRVNSPRAPVDDARGV